MNINVFFMFKMVEISIGSTPHGGPNEKCLNIGYSYGRGMNYRVCRIVRI